MVNKEKDVVSTFEKMENLHEVWSRNLKEEANIIEKDFMHLFSYYKKEIISLNQLGEKTIETETTYQNTKLSLSNRKKSLLEKPFEEWNLSIDEKDYVDSENDKESLLEFHFQKQDKRVERMCLVFGHYLINFHEEKKRLSKYYGRLFKRHFKELSERNADYLDDRVFLTDLFRMD